MISKLKAWWFILFRKPHDGSEALRQQEINADMERRWGVGTVITQGEADALRHQQMRDFMAKHEKREQERARVLVELADRLLDPDQKVIVVLPDSRVLETAGKSRPN